MTPRLAAALALLGAGFGVGLWQRMARQTPSPGIAPVTARPVTLAHVSAAQMRARLAEQPPFSLGPVGRCRELALQELGLQDRLAVRGWREALGTLTDATPSAAYLVGTDSILLAPGGEAELRHEWQHATDDQRGSWGAVVLAESTTTEQRLTLASLAEVAAQRVRSPSTDPHPWTTLAALEFDLGHRPARWGLSVEAATERLAQRPIPTWAGDLWGYGPLAATSGDVAPSNAPAPLCTDRVGPMGLVVLVYQKTKQQLDPAQLAAAWSGDTIEVRPAGTGHQVQWRAHLRPGALRPEVAQALQRHLALTADGLLALGARSDGFPVDHR